MSPNTYMEAAMALIKTAEDLGQRIRARRKALGWDQARLARDVGVSRQWVVDIEKGKARAEVGLALRALHVLGLGVEISAPEQREAAGATTFPPDAGLIDAIVERSAGHRLADTIEFSKAQVQRITRGLGASGTSRTAPPPASHESADPHRKTSRAAQRKPTQVAGRPPKRAVKKAADGVRVAPPKPVRKRPGSDRPSAVTRKRRR